MKKLLIIIPILLVLLSGCGGPIASEEPCLYCSKKPAFLYELNGQKTTFCEDCYKIEYESVLQDRLNLKNGIN